MLVPTHGEDAVIPSGALGGVELLAYFFASCGMGNSVILSEFSVLLVGGPRQLVTR